MPLISRHPAAPRAASTPAPGWLVEVVRFRKERVPWGQMIHAVLAVCVPLAAGLAAGRPVLGVLPATGGLLSALVNPSGPYRVRVVRISVASVFGGAAGLIIGTLIHGRGWAEVAALVAVAGVSALISAIGATASQTGLQLLVYTSLATGPLGTIRPWWLAPLMFLAGVAWGVVLLLPGWLVAGRAAQLRQVAEVYRALVRKLAATGTSGFEDARREVTAELNAAYDGLLAARSATSGRDPYQAWLMALLNQALVLAEASAALAAEGRRPPQRAASAVAALADAIQHGGPPPAVPDPPPEATPGTAALHDGVAGAAALVARGPGPPGQHVPGPPMRAASRRERLAGLADRFRGGRFAMVFTVRLMLCIGIAAVISNVLPLQRSYWVTLTVAIVLKPDFGSVFARAVQRGFGTVIGAGLGAAAVAVTPFGPLLLIPLAGCAFLFPYGRSRNYGMFSTFLTPLVVLLIDLLARGGWRLAEARVVDTLAGCAVVLLAGYAPWPASWYAHLPGKFADAADGAAAYLMAALAGAPGERCGLPRLRRRMYRTLYDLRTQFQRSLSEPAAASRRAATWWPAVVALERVMDQVTAASVGVQHGSPRPPAAAVASLAAALRSIAAAVRSGRPPPAGLAALPGSGELRPVAEAVRGVRYALTGQSGPKGPPRAS